jgi:hypothetical protein
LKVKIYRLYLKLLNVFNNVETLDLLIKAVMDTWERLGKDLFNTLINIMERRVKVVVEAKGWYTKY